MNEPLSIKYIHKPARSSTLINQNSLSLNLTRNSQFNKDTSYSQITDENQRDAGDEISVDSNESSRTNSYDDCTKIDLGDNNYTYDDDPNKPKREDYFGGAKLVRKKSGEILKSSLKDKFISKSLPSTPNSKQVHFGTAFDIKFFRKKDKPNAISATNSPVVQSPEFNSVEMNDDTDDTSDYSGEEEISDDEEDFGYARFNGLTNYPNPKHNKLIDWRLRMLNFNEVDCESMMAQNKPIFLERIFISIDKKYLLGHIAVKNLSFEKFVSLKYTFNNWNTIVEIPSIYVPDFPMTMKRNNYDRFVFKIPLNNLFISNSNSFYEENNFKFCLKYVANDQELWDNNDFKNYEINLIKIIKNDPDPYNANFNNFNFSEAFSKSQSFPAPRKSNKAVISHENLTRSHHDSLTATTRPKYSNSYLKRVNSDSQLDIDYVKNNFYLSSPLLSSLNNQHHDLNNNSTDTLTGNNLDNVSEYANTPKLQEFNNFTNSNFNGSSGINNFDLAKEVDSINSKSYKDLIDNYCFFNSDKKDDQTFSVQSLLGT